MRLIAFPQWDKVTSLLRGMTRQSAANYAQRKIVRIILENGVVRMCGDVGTSFVTHGADVSEWRRGHIGGGNVLLTCP